MAERPAVNDPIDAVAVLGEPDRSPLPEVPMFDPTVLVALPAA